MPTAANTAKEPDRPFLSVRSDGVHQYRRWEKAAKREGVMLSQWVRRALDTAASTKPEKAQPKP